MGEDTQTPKNCNDKHLELYKISREQVLRYGDLRWKRLATYLTSTGLFFAALAFALDRLGGLMCIIIAALGTLYTLCFMAIEMRAGRTLRQWVLESHRLEASMGGQNVHAKDSRIPSQQVSFQIMYGLFTLGWIAVGAIVILQRYVFFFTMLRVLEQMITD